MLDADDCAMMNPLSSINLVQMMSVLLRWPHVSVYKAKAVYSSLSSLLQKIRRAVVSCREKLLLSSACVGVNDVTEGEAEDDTASGANVSVSQLDAESPADTGGVTSGWSGKTIGEVEVGASSVGNAATADMATPVTTGVSNPNVTAHADGTHADIAQNSPKEVSDALTSEAEDAKDKEEKEESSALQMLIQMSCLISSLLGQAACSLIEGNVNTTVSAIILCSSQMYLLCRQ